MQDCLERHHHCTGLVTVHPESVDALFNAATTRNMRLIAGEVLMDRHAPEALTDTAETAYIDSKALIEKWHGQGGTCMRLPHALHRPQHLNNYKKPDSSKPNIRMCMYIPI